MKPGSPIITGSLCYLLRDDDSNNHDSGARSVLLLKRCRPPHQGLWSAPGGKLEPGESPDDCVRREVREETGLVIIQPALRAIVTVYDAAWPVHWLLFIYRAVTFSGTLRPTPTEEGELRWIPLDQLSQFERPYADRQSWPHVLGDDPGIWRGKFVYDTPQRLVEEIRYV